MDPRYRYNSTQAQQQMYDPNGNYWNANFNLPPRPPQPPTYSAYPNTTNGYYDYNNNLLSNQVPQSQYSYPRPAATYRYPSSATADQNATGLTQVLSSYKHGPTVIMMEKKKSKSLKKKLLWGTVLAAILSFSLLWSYGYVEIDQNLINKMPKLPQISPLETIMNRIMSSASPVPESEAPLPIMIDYEEMIAATLVDNNNSSPFEMDSALSMKTKVIWSFDEDDDDEVFIESIQNHKFM